MAVEIGWGYPSKVEKPKKGKPQTEKEETKPQEKEK
mgnify:CR=1 FL=1